MTDFDPNAQPTTATASVDPAPPAPVAAPVTPTPAVPTLDYDALADAMHRRAAAPTAAPAPPAPVAASNLFSVGQIVTHTWFDPYAGRQRTRHGIVVAIHEPGTLDAGEGARSSVAWLDAVSGPIGDEQLEGV